tara:strand:- start:795 stop:1274 length:480 start_codon:yes stop_codon:yes gene_type:complete
MAGHSWVAIAKNIVEQHGFVISLSPIVPLNVRALCTAESKKLAMAHTKEYVNNVARLADTDHAHLLRVFLLFAAANGKAGALALRPHTQQPMQAAMQRVCSPTRLPPLATRTMAVDDEEWKKALVDDKKVLRAAIDAAIDPSLRLRTRTDLSGHELLGP